MFHNSSTYDYYFIIKKLAEKFEEQFECLGGNILLFQYQLKKNLIMVKQRHTKQSFMIALDLYQGHYQILLIIYLKDFIVINA